MPTPPPGGGRGPSALGARRAATASRRAAAVDEVDRVDEEAVREVRRDEGPPRRGGSGGRGLRRRRGERRSRESRTPGRLDHPLFLLTYPYLAHCICRLCSRGCRACRLSSRWWSSSRSGRLSPPLHPQSRSHPTPHMTRALGLHGFGELRPRPCAVLGLILKSKDTHRPRAPQAISRSTCQP